MNKVILEGRPTKDPELKFTPGNGTAVCTLTLAVNRRFKREGQPEADFIPIIIWNKQAESVANYVTKGKLISVVGRMETRSYDAKDGSKRYVTEVIAEEVNFLEWGNKNEGQATQQNSGIPGDYFGGADYIPDESEDMPF